MGRGLELSRSRQVPEYTCSTLTLASLKYHFWLNDVYYNFFNLSYRILKTVMHVGYSNAYSELCADLIYLQMHRNWYWEVVILSILI